MQSPSLPEPNKPKGRSVLVGCLIVGGLGLVALLGFVVWLGLPAFMIDSGRMMTNATTGPGVRSLKDSGCAQAAVTDLDELHRLGTKVNSKLGPRQPPSVRFNVACFVADSSKAPTCDDVARVYLHAPGVQPAAINAVVRIGQRRDSSRLHCSKLYSAEGESSGDAPEVLD
jgi:hypothetical protein